MTGIRLRDDGTWRLLRHPTRGRSIRLGILGFWTAMGIVESSKAYVSLQLRDIPASWDHALVANVPWWYGWALLTPAIFWLARRLRLDRRGWQGVIALHLVVALAFSFLHLGFTGTLFFYTVSRGVYMASVGQQIRGFVDGYLAVDVLTYFAVVGSYYIIDFARRHRERDVAAAQLEARMHEARLAALRMELNPHFLFNALNAVAGLVRRREHDTAVDALAGIGELLRLTLDRGAKHESSLEDELMLVRQYLRIEQLRFHDRLTVREEIDPAIGEALVPTLILQPLVENAIRHGIARLPGPGCITLRAERIAEQLVLVVRDTGCGYRDDRVSRNGIGLANTRARLGQLYDGNASVEITNPPGGGAEVTVRLPFHSVPVPGVA